MRKLSVFNQMSLDGYICDGKGDLSWAYVAPDEDQKAWSQEAANTHGPLLLGRVTYDMMIQFWPTPAAQGFDKKMADGMNARPKYVFSRRLKQSTWSNTHFFSDPVADVKKMKKEPGDDMTILGSGSVVSLLTQVGLIDEYAARR